jgi:hypothetical protein
MSFDGENDQVDPYMLAVFHITSLNISFTTLDNVHYQNDWTFLTSTKVKPNGLHAKVMNYVSLILYTERKV